MINNDPLSVLYIEDDNDIRALMEIAVDGEGIELSSFSSGTAAVASAAVVTPDLIVLDVMMPGIDGPETLRQLRGHAHLASVPAVFMTAKAQESEITALEALGVAAVITKPFDPLSIGEALRKIVTESHD